MFRHRLLSVRAYDAAAMLVGAQVVNGSELEDAIRHLFAIEEVSYLHIHNAGPGCYNCCVVRAVMATVNPRIIQRAALVLDFSSYPTILMA